MASINPYLTFNGNCEEAFKFYKKVFGTDYTSNVRFKDMKSEHPTPEAMGDKIMHVSLPIGNGLVLMGSDSPQWEVKIGNNISISIVATSQDEADKLFNGLSAGGNVTMPMDKTFWGAYFGMFVDKFGIPWMVNYDIKP